MYGNDEQTRRTFLVTGAAAATGLTFALPDLAAGQQLPLTPECKGKNEPTIRQTEGPFFKPKSPFRTDLREPALKGELIVISGLVLTRGCKPVANALVDLWHADGNGDYDNKGFRGRGHQFTDSEGRYNFITVRAGRYPGRTLHYHVKLQAANRPVLTTQLYFPDDPGNARDAIFRKELLMRFVGDRTPPVARFDFVLDIA
jgi:protocatechuate 3,4-dioxygenase beta subunit